MAYKLCRTRRGGHGELDTLVAVSGLDDHDRKRVPTSLLTHVVAGLLRVVVEGFKPLALDNVLHARGPHKDVPDASHSAYVDTLI